MFLHLGAFAVLLITAVLSVPCRAFFPSDLVTRLPLLNQTLPSQHFSGYLQASNSTFLHYYFVEATQVMPAHAPVILWLNGGPGCSSMDGWGYEMGPVRFHTIRNPQKGVPLVELNKYAWTRYANMIFLESPAGVGFSYRLDKYSTTNDEETAQLNHDALVDFFARKFPEYAHNKLYIAGESYAGIYVPTLVQEILNRGILSHSLAGMVIGNGVCAQCTADLGVGCQMYMEGDVKFALYHNIIDQAFYDEGVVACKNITSAECGRHQSRLFLEFATHLNVYDVYQNCIPEQPQRWWEHIPGLRLRLLARMRQLGYDSVEQYFAEQARTDPPHPSGRTPPCVDVSGLTYYLNRADVRDALHIPYNFTWAVCSNINYNHSVSDVSRIYGRMRELNLSVLVYNGNTDAGIPHTYVEYWMENGLRFPVTRAFHSWDYDDPIDGTQKAGTAVQRGNLWYVTVHGAGHMVPQDRPLASLEMIRRFLWEIGF